MRPAGSSEALERRRRRALALLKSGLTPVEVARQVGVDRRSVRRWKAAVRAGGEAALRAQATPGRPPKLSARERKRLERWLLEGAETSGFATDLWTGPRVAQLIRRRLHVRYHVNHMGRLLHSLGWSAQKPARRALERDEAAIRRWLKEEWPRVKKTLPAAGRPSSSATKRGS